jgi:phosphoglycolate phosphatase
MPLLKIGPSDFSPRLVVFDKDGTLIDFNFMWASWITELAQRLNVVGGHDVSARLFGAYGFDPAASRVLPGGPLAVGSMAELRGLSIEVLCASGFPRDLATGIAERAWFVPNPVKSARPLADLPRLFGLLKARGLKTAVATSDDRAATEKTLAGVGIAQFVDAVVGADEGLPNKPAPDMILHLCRRLEVLPEHTMMVGDAVADLEMGRTAGIGVRVGVLSGVSSAQILAPFADVLLLSVGELV